MAELVLFPNEMDRLLRMPGGPVGRHCNYVARQIANEASRLASTRLNKRTGRLANGYRVQVERTGGSEGFRFWVINTVTGQDPRRKMSYAQVHEDGSGTHGPRGAAYPIRARNPKKPLVFYVNGRKVVTKSVMHPGVRPQHIMRDAMTSVMDRI